MVKERMLSLRKASIASADWSWGERGAVTELLGGLWRLIQAG